MGEAAAVVVLEGLDHAQARGAKIYAELLGYGISSDASHMTEPDPTGENPARAMTMAIADAGIDADRRRLRERARDVDAARRLRRDTRDQARVRRGACDDEARGLVDEGRDRPLLRRRRRGRGGLHRARGRDRKAPPTINYEEPDPDCDLDYVPNVARDLPGPDVRPCRTPSASAVTTPSIVVRRWDDD